MTTRHWAVAQMNTGDDLEANLDVALDFIEQASGEGCSLISFPEVFLFRGSKQSSRENGLQLDSPEIEQLRDTANQHSIHVQAGSILSPPENDPSADRLFNTALLINDDGELVETYQKIHLFDVELPDFEVKESDLMRSGDQPVDAEVDGVHCGLTVCYDLRFPELYRELTSRGVEVLFVPSNFTRETGRAHWEPLLRARAIENQAYVVAPNLIGPNPHTGVASLGQSMIVDPWGQVVTRMSDYPGWTSAQLDFSYLEDVRRRLPALEHRRL